MKRKLETGKSMPLAPMELDYLANLLEHSSFNIDLNEKIWSIVHHSSSNSSLLKIAKNTILQSSSSDDTVFKHHAELIFYYYLENSSIEEQQEIIETLTNCKSLRLRMIIAEFFMKKGNIKMGLHLMADISNETGTDHALHDSIMIWMCQKATSEIKKEFLQKAVSERVKGNISSAKQYEWLCNNCMADI